MVQVSLDKHESKTKNEQFPEELDWVDDLPKEPLPEQYELERIGEVSSVISALVVVQGRVDASAIDADSVLWTQDRNAFGKVFEVGPCASLSFRRGGCVLWACDGLS